METGRSQHNYNLVKHFYFYINNCICQLFKAIPEPYLTEDFVNYYRRIRSEVDHISQ